MIGVVCRRRTPIGHAVRTRQPARSVGILQHMLFEPYFAIVRRVREFVLRRAISISSSLSSLRIVAVIAAMPGFMRLLGDSHREGA